MTALRISFLEVPPPPWHALDPSSFKIKEDLEGWGHEAECGESLWDAAWAGNQEEHRPPSKSQFRHLLKSPERLQSCLELEEDTKSFEIYVLATWESTEITPFSLGLRSNRTKDKGWGKSIRCLGDWHSSPLLTQPCARASESSLQKTGSVGVSSFSVTYVYSETNLKTANYPQHHNWTSVEDKAENRNPELMHLLELIGSEQH